MRAFRKISSKRTLIHLLLEHSDAILAILMNILLQQRLEVSRIFQLKPQAKLMLLEAQIKQLNETKEKYEKCEKVFGRLSLLVTELLGPDLSLF